MSGFNVLNDGTLSDNAVYLNKNSQKISQRVSQLLSRHEKFKEGHNL